MTYHIGQALRLHVKYTDYDGDPAAPTVSVLRILDPSGTETTPTVTRNTDPETEAPETGTDYGDVIPTMAGEWTYRWEGDGAVEATAEGAFFVASSAFTNPD